MGYSRKIIGKNRNLRKRSRKGGMRGVARHRLAKAADKLHYPNIYSIDYLHNTTETLRDIVLPFNSVNSFFNYLLEQLIDYDGIDTKDEILKEMFRKIDLGGIPDPKDPTSPYIKFSSRKGTGIKVLDKERFKQIISDIISKDFDNLSFISNNLMKIKCILASFLSFLKYASLNIYLGRIDIGLETIDNVIEANTNTTFVALKLNIVFPNMVDNFNSVFDQINDIITEKYYERNNNDVNKIIYNPSNPKLGLKNYKDESTKGKLGAISADIPQYCTFGIPLPLGINIPNINSRILENKSWLGESDSSDFAKSINLTKLSHGGAFITLVFKYEGTYYLLGMVEKDGYGNSSIYKNGTAGGTIDYEEKNDSKKAATRELFEEIFMMESPYFNNIYEYLKPITGKNIDDEDLIADFKDRFVVSGHFPNGTYQKPIKLNDHTLQSGFLTETIMENFLCIIDLKLRSLNFTNTNGVESWLNNFLIEIQNAITNLGNPEGIHNVFILNMNTNNIIRGNNNDETLVSLLNTDFIKTKLLKPIRLALDVPELAQAVGVSTDGGKRIPTDKKRPTKTRRPTKKEDQ